jgi:hypothetical protein
VIWAQHRCDLVISISRTFKLYNTPVGKKWGSWDKTYFTTHSKVSKSIFIITQDKTFFTAHSKVSKTIFNDTLEYIKMYRFLLFTTQSNTIEHIRIFYVSRFMFYDTFLTQIYKILYSSRTHSFTPFYIKQDDEYLCYPA